MSGPEGTPNGADRLAHIEAAPTFENPPQAHAPGLWVRLRAEDRDALVEIARAMERIAEQQPKTIDWLEANGIVFDNLDDHWQKVAFSIYIDLCEVDSIARNALETLNDAD